MRVDHAESGVQLGRWVVAQRQAYRRGTLTADRVATLTAIDGWVWRVPRRISRPLGRRSSEAEMLAALRVYAARTGHTRMYADHIEGRHPLGKWVDAQRRLGRGKAPRLALQAIRGWTWPIRVRHSVDAWIGAVEQFYARTGHTRVPVHHYEGSLPLGAWVRLQLTRRRCRPTIISAEIVRRLDQVRGWSWESRTRRAQYSITARNT